MRAPQYLYRRSEYDGTYRNRYRKGGTGLRWAPWRTIAAYATLEEALAHQQRDNVGLAHRGVFYRGERLTDDQCRPLPPLLRRHVTAGG
jgi:hypothetical protein